MLKILSLYFFMSKFSESLEVRLFFPDRTSKKLAGPELHIINPDRVGNQGKLPIFNMSSFTPKTNLVLVLLFNLKFK